MKRKIKWIAIVIAAIVFIALGTMLPGEPLTQRSIIVGFGIDMAGEEQITVSAQILNPGGGQDQSGTETNLVSATDSTLAGAMNKISEKSSHTVALTHCNVVFVGKNVAETKNVYSVINYLLSNSYLSENAFLFLADETAKEILESKTGFGDNASLYTQSIVGLYGDYNDIASKTVQCFIVGYHSLGESNWLPVVKKEPTPPKLSDDSAPKEEPQYLFDINSMAVFLKNEYKGDFDAAGTRAYNYVDYKIKKGAINTTGANGEKILIYLTGNKAEKKFDYDSKTVSVEVELNGILKEIVDFDNDDIYIDRTNMTPEEIENTQKEIEAEILDFFTKTRDMGVDIFNFRESFAFKFGKKGEELNIKDLNMNVKVKLSLSD